MKNSFLTAATLFVVVLATSCKKDDLTSVPVSASSTAESYVETSLPVQKLITHTVDANIGGYLEALPAHYADHPLMKYPLIIFLHGIGEVGDGSQASLPIVTDNSIPHLLATQTFPANFTVNGFTRQFIVLSPQFKVWPGPSDVNDMLNYAIKKYQLDYERLYVVGLSMGGGVTWDYGWNYGKRITAIVPMAGASWPTTEKAQAIVQDTVAVWAFHNNNDPTVPSWYSTDWVQYINSYNPFIPAKLTVFQSSSHDCWTQASDPNYRENGMNIYEWMLSYKKIKK